MKTALKSVFLFSGLLFGGALVASAAGCSPFFVASGGTGRCAFTANTVLIGNGTGAIATTSAGTNGFVLALSGGVPTWVATSSINNGVSSLTGTANQVSVSASTGAVTVSLAGPHNFTTVTGCLTGNGTSAITGSGTCATFAWPFTIAANGGVSTSTLMQFLGNASTTQISATTAYFGGTGTTTIGSTGIGIGTTTPPSTNPGLVLDRTNGFASSSILVYGYAPTATSTTPTINCASSNTIHLSVGTSASTFTLAPMQFGNSCSIIVQNPNASAGAITWVAASGQPIYWCNSTTPTQTTTANKRDYWSFKADIENSNSTSTPGVSILGCQTPNF